VPGQVKARIGLTIREFRLRLGYSQEVLAEKCGLHRTYIGGVERGERNISLENIVRIARALRVTPSQLLQGIK
jgi:transcriptional regulator with XRE-family HTH domain